jgi:hypothetical protein
VLWAGERPFNAFPLVAPIHNRSSPRPFSRNDWNSGSYVQNSDRTAITPLCFARRKAVRLLPAPCFQSTTDLALDRLTAMTGAFELVRDPSLDTTHYGRCPSPGL